MSPLKFASTMVSGSNPARTRSSLLATCRSTKRFRFWWRQTLRSRAQVCECRTLGRVRSRSGSNPNWFCNLAQTEEIGAMALPDMRRRISFLFLLLVISPLSGCAIVERWQAWQAWQAPLPPTPNLLPQERLQLAIDLLDRGKSRRANVELKAYRADLTNDNGLPGKPSPNGSAVANGNAAGNSNAAATGNAVANSNAAGNSNVVANSKPAPPPPQILPRMKPDDPPSPAPK